MNNETTSSSSDSEMASKITRSLKMFVKNCHNTFDKKMKFNCHDLKAEDDNLFKNRSRRPTLFKRPLLTMLNLKVDRIFLQKLEYEIYRTDYPSDYIFLGKDIVVTLTSLTQIFSWSKPVV